MRRILTLGVLCAALLACKGSKPSAMDACRKLEAAGVAANCRTESPAGIWAAAAEGAAFDLPSVPGKGGFTMRFEGVEQYDATAKAYAAAEIGAKAKAAIDGM